jgi:ATP-dependent DNA helicase RecQ
LGHFLEGKSLEEIAALRSLAVSTVENHLTKAIAAGQLKLESWVPTDESALIEGAIREHGAEGLKPVFDALQGKYSYGIIRAVGASL